MLVSDPWHLHLWIVHRFCLSDSPHVRLKPPILCILMLVSQSGSSPRFKLPTRCCLQNGEKSWKIMKHILIVLYHFVSNCPKMMGIVALFWFHSISLAFSLPRRRPNVMRARSASWERVVTWDDRLPWLKLWSHVVGCFSGPKVPKQGTRSQSSQDIAIWIHKVKIPLHVAMLGQGVLCPDKLKSQCVIKLQERIIVVTFFGTSNFRLTTYSQFSDT